MTGLTARQRDCLVAIAAFRAKHRTSPNFDELKYALGLSAKSRIHRLVVALAERGMISLPYHRPRALTVTGAGEATLRRTCPMRGNEPMRFIQVPTGNHTEASVNRHCRLSTIHAAPQSAGLERQGLNHD